jgi:hypothetical protein
MPAADLDDQRGVRLQVAGEIPEARKLKECPEVRDRVAPPEGDNYSAVEPRRERVASCRVLGGRDLRVNGEGEGGRRRGDKERERGHESQPTE